MPQSKSTVLRLQLKLKLHLRGRGCLGDPVDLAVKTEQLLSFMILHCLESDEASKERERERERDTVHYTK